MKTVHYTKPKKDFVRTLRPIDLASLGIQSKETLVWSEQNNFCLLLSDELSDSLVEKLPTELKAVDAEGDEPLEVDDSNATSQLPEEIVDDSEGDEIDDDESLTLDDEEES